MGCYVSAGVTGAHLNPAVTLALAVHRRFPWHKVLPYSVAQIAGAFVASAVVYVTYHEALTAFDNGVRQVTGPLGTAGIWATYPQPFLSTFPGGFIDQVVGTALLVGVILGDHRHAQLAAARRTRAGRRRPAGRAHRRDVRFQLRIRDQPGARLRAAAVHVRGRLGRRGVSRRQRLVVGADRGAVCRRRGWRMGSTTSLSGVGSRIQARCNGWRPHGLTKSSEWLREKPLCGCRQTLASTSRTFVLSSSIVNGFWMNCASVL